MATAKAKAAAKVTAKAKPNEILSLDPKAVHTGKRVRTDLGAVEELAASIKELGQLHPIVVAPDGRQDRFNLVAGMRRMRACQQLGIKVLARVVDVRDELHELLMQVHENAKRKDFDAVENYEAILRGKQLYEQVHPETKAGSTGGGSKGKGTRTKTEIATTAKSDAVPAPRFSQVAAQATGYSERRIYEFIEIASLPEKMKKRIREAETSAERDQVIQDCLKQVRTAKKTAELEKQAERNKQLDIEDANAAKKPPVILYQGDNKTYLKGEKLYELVLADPPYDRERSLIGHIARASIGKTLAWDKLDLGWVVKAAPLLTDGGQMIVFCPLEAIGGYELAFEAAELTYRGALIWHKCVSEETLVPVVTEDGLHRLRPSEIQPGDRIISVGVDGAAMLAKVMSTERMGCRESLVRVTLADGNTATVTPDHRIPTRGGKLVEAGKLGVGDEVLVATTFPLEAPGSGYKEDRELGRIAGIWLGGGGFSSSRASRVEFYLSRAKAETVGFLEEALPRFFEAKIGRFEDRDYTTDPPGPIGSGQGIRLYSHNDALRSFLGGVFAGVSVQTKRIRPQTFMRGREFLQGMVDGFCETDGAWDEFNHRWRFNQGNAELLRDFSILLKVLGLPSKLYPPRTVADGFTAAMHTCWPMEFRPEISRHHNSTFKDEAHGVCPVKVAKIEAAPGGAVWDLAVDSDSHLFAVDHGMLVHNSNAGTVYRSVYLPACEAIVWATKGGKYTFHAWEEQAGAVAHNLIAGPICQGNERLGHPCTKPEWLIERLLKRHTVAGQRVLDPFAGSGTTLVVCKKLGLACIGVEREEEYVQMAKLRLAAVK